MSAAFSNRSMGPTNQDKLWTIQYNIIQELAEKSSCVIVGRCADYVLRDKADCLKVFIHSDLEHRAAYYRFCTDMKWGRAQNYHVCLDSGELGIEKCVEIIYSSISSVPATTRISPSSAFLLSFSWNTSQEKRMVMRILSLSMGTTTLARPS